MVENCRPRPPIAVTYRGGAPPFTEIVSDGGRDND
jgi:hypothetical protein